jgi:peptidoglycan/LPS O-acetylase OafA/YrhL
MNLYSDKTTRLSIGALGALSALFSLWQFYLFVQFRNATGQPVPQGGSINLWLAISAAAVACVAIAFLFFFAVNYDKSVDHIAYYEQAHK